MSNKEKTRVQVSCDSGISNKCQKTFVVSERSRIKNIKNNNGKFLCQNCAIRLKMSGRNNPNCKIKNLNDNFFETIDSEEKAWLLGWIASDGNVNINQTIAISIHEKDIGVLDQMRKILSMELVIRKRKENMRTLLLCSIKMVEDVCKHLNISTGKKDFIVDFPTLNSDKLTWCFLRGLFEGDGTLSNLYKESPNCSISSCSSKMKHGIFNFCNNHGIDSRIDHRGIFWNTKETMLILKNIYNNSNYYLQRKRDLYYDWENWSPNYKSGALYIKRIDGIKFAKTKENSIFPEKIGNKYSLWVSEKIKTFNDIVLCTSGIKVQIPDGYYLEFIHSQLDNGYVVTNYNSTINGSLKGDIEISLCKIANKELIFPFRVGYLYLRKTHNFEVIELK